VYKRITGGGDYAVKPSRRLYKGVYGSVVSWINPSSIQAAHWRWRLSPTLPWESTQPRARPRSAASQLAA